MGSGTDHLPFLRRYLEAVGRMAVGEELAAFYTPDAVQQEFPNKITPVTATRTVADILAGAERGKKLLAKQEFRVLNSVASGDTVVLETEWIGTLALPVGSIPAGGEMKARFAVFFEMREGKIAAQRNYDCFDPF